MAHRDFGASYISNEIILYYPSRYRGNIVETNFIKELRWLNSPEVMGRFAIRATHGPVYTAIWNFTDEETAIMFKLKFG